jgi:SAM-dependent methyltransferase
MTEPAFLGGTRAAYDTVAADYAEHTRTGLADRPLERGLLAAFAEIVQTAGARPVADLGCGPGHVTAYLHGLGLDVFGVDLSPGMIASARKEYPDLRFDEGSMTALHLPDSTLGGITAFYSTIHLPLDQVPGVFAEFHRVLAPGGQVLVAFQVGDEQRQRTEAFGHPVTLDYYLRPPEVVAELLDQAGLPVKARLVREPGEGETVPRAHLLAHKPT